MGRGKNTFSLAAGFNITGQQPIDSRLVVDTVADLYLDETWEGVGLYNGLVVATKDAGSLYVLIDRDNYIDTSSWVQVGVSSPTEDSGLELVANSIRLKLDNSNDNRLSLSKDGLKATCDSYTLEKSTKASSHAAVYEFKKNGELVTEINIPKDQFLSNAEFITASQEDAENYNIVAGDPYIKLTFFITGSDDAPIFVPVKELVDTYIQGGYISIDDNVVSVDYESLKEALKTDFNLDNESDRVTDVIGDLNLLEKALEFDFIDTKSSCGINLTSTPPEKGQNVLNTVGISVDLDTLASNLKAKLLPSANEVVLNSKIGNLDPDVDEGKPTVQDALEYLEGQITTMAAGGITTITTTKAADETDPKLIITKEDNSTTVNIDVNVGALISNTPGNIIKLNSGKLYAHMNWEVL